MTRTKIPLDSKEFFVLVLERTRITGSFESIFGGMVGGGQNDYPCDRLV
jgi:hypothetical protein